jgi:hypothetical protein
MLTELNVIQIAFVYLLKYWLRQLHALHEAERLYDGGAQITGHLQAFFRLRSRIF